MWGRTIVLLKALVLVLCLLFSTYSSFFLAIQPCCSPAWWSGQDSVFNSDSLRCQLRYFVFEIRGVFQSVAFVWADQKRSMAFCWCHTTAHLFIYNGSELNMGELDKTVTLCCKCHSLDVNLFSDTVWKIWHKHGCCEVNNMIKIDRDIFLLKKPLGLPLNSGSFHNTSERNTLNDLKHKRAK